MDAWLYCEKFQNWIPGNRLKFNENRCTPTAWGKKSLFFCRRNRRIRKSFSFIKFYIIAAAHQPKIGSKRILTTVGTWKWQMMPRRHPEKSSADTDQEKEEQQPSQQPNIASSHFKIRLVQPLLKSSWFCLVTRTFRRFDCCNIPNLWWKPYTWKCIAIHNHEKVQSLLNVFNPY